MGRHQFIPVGVHGILTENKSAQTTSPLMFSCAFASLPLPASIVVPAVKLATSPSTASFSNGVASIAEKIVCSSARVQGAAAHSETELSTWIVPVSYWNSGSSTSRTLTSISALV